MSASAVTLARNAVVRSFTVAGTEQFCWDFSPLDDAGAPPVLMVHGFRGDHHGLLRIVESLPRHRVLVPDLPGFGIGSALPGRHDVPAYASFVREALAALDLGPDTVLLGHSFGSIISSHLAAQSPELISELVLVNPICEPALEGPKGITSKAAELYYRASAALPERPGMALLRSPLIVRGMSIMMAKTRDPGLRRWIHGQHDAYFSAFANRAVVLDAFRASISATVRDVAAQLAMPVLLIAAEQDDLGSVKGQRKLAAMIPDAELHILPGVGHLVHYEKPAEAAAIIEDFLSRRHT
ncbi:MULTISPECIES: alpha/beta fold hydrolase [unclassified Arthrobacter]|uniref:alpha/beta fold hydrolase n=1 Tax=unclassified Arthrobacter TaxID=235627 RepID=UPI001D1360C2|nr:MULTISPECIES: alpha/beta hydrolase [unclassified Arthrobacter]MCC3274848.1 alpha/beta hydrolase [Arthrobacter sp. zg-Y20]MCC9177558.1 alpha/beta hydrolase [Arthrobacter sp. zg-Y750]MDK1315004.1 alpha/beta hydrolase [Arthrobacter sp. zg.Y20]WIB04855.1 alpha/beta hydrolase [Arthrobacter sp. zg-Y20]